jgi:hypothetical protein
MMRTLVDVVRKWMDRCGTMVPDEKGPKLAMGKGVPGSRVECFRSSKCSYISLRILRTKSSGALVSVPTFPSKNAKYLHQEPSRGRITPISKENEIQISGDERPGNGPCLGGHDVVS